MQQGFSTSNFGSEPELRTDSGGTAGADTAESYLRFSVGGISGKVTGAKLRVRSDTQTVDGPALRGTSNSWTEGGITWANRPAPTTGVVSDVSVIGPDTWTEWDVSALVTADGTYSFQLALPTVVANKSYVLTAMFRSSDGERFFDRVVLESAEPEQEEPGERSAESRILGPGAKRESPF